ncbi:MAG: helicase-related protein [archaeon]|nr:hypothetical protein [Nanoarchaeota archaeon]
MDNTLKVALDTIQMGKQAIVFAPSKASAEKTAEDLSLLMMGNGVELLDLEAQVLKAVSPATRQCKRLAKIVKKGVAFHHAGLANKQRELIEDEFRAGRIKVICATPTLAAGLSMPAFRVILKSLKRFSGKWGMDWIPVLEYMQMAGRAGRPEHEDYGEAISVARDEKDKEEIYQKYVCGVPEDIYSKLAAEPVLRTYLLSLIASGIIRTEHEMKDFFRSTFWAHQYQDFTELENIMDRMLGLLVKWGFVRRLGDLRLGADGFVTTEPVEDEKEIVENSEKDFGFEKASSILAKVKKIPGLVGGKNKKTDDEKSDMLKATLIGKRVSQLYLDPLTAKHLIDALHEANKKDSRTAFAYLQILSNTLEMRPRLRIKSKEQDWIQEELLAHYEELLEEEPAEYDYSYHDFMDSIKTTLFFEAWTNEVGEDLLLEKFNVRPGEIKVKLDTADWLIYSSEEMADLLNYRDLVSELRKLRLRVKNGAKEELLVLLKLKNIGRKRARRMFNNGIKDMGDLKRIDLATLGQILGKKVAEDVKSQLGQEVKEVPAGRRKGQLGLGKYKLE